MFTKNPLYPTLDEVINYFSDKWAEKKDKVEWSDEIQKVYYQDGVGIIKKFYTKNQPWNFAVVDLESRFEVPLHDPETEEDHVLAGIIDRIDKPSDDSYEIIDYKTARRMPAQDVLDRDLQMSIYHLGLIKRWPHLEARNIKLSLYFLKHNEKISTTRDKLSLENTKNKILKTIHEIENRVKENDFPPTPGPLCDWCGYRKMCPMWKHMYKSSESEITSEEELKPVIDEYLSIKKEAEDSARRIKFLQGMLHEFMNAKEVERVFGDGGYITRTTKEKFSYNIALLKPILEKAGKWKEIWKVDEPKLEKIIQGLSPAIQEKVKKDAVLTKKTTQTLTVSRKKVEQE